MAGRLTTHVLDTMHGRSATGVSIQLWRLSGSEERKLLKTVRTNANGRTDEPLLMDSEFVVGRYELVFIVGAYFAALQVPASTPPFLDEVPVRFGLADPDAHYHVPLLISPWAYSTYRGS